MQRKTDSEETVRCARRNGACAVLEDLRRRKARDAASRWPQAETEEEEDVINGTERNALLSSKWSEIILYLVAVFVRATSFNSAYFGVPCSCSAGHALQADLDVGDFGGGGIWFNALVMTGQWRLYIDVWQLWDIGVGAICHGR